MSTIHYKTALQIEIADRQWAIEEESDAQLQARERMVVLNLRLAVETSADRLPTLWEFWNRTNFNDDGLNYAAAEAAAVLEYVLENEMQ